MNAKGFMISMTAEDIQRLEVLMTYLRCMNRSEVIRNLVIEKLDSLVKESHEDKR